MHSAFRSRATGRLCGILFILICCTCCIPRATAQHRILLGSYGANELMILGKNNQVEWTMPELDRVTDVHQMQNHHILIAHTSGISEIIPDYQSGSGGEIKRIWTVPSQSEFTGNKPIPPKNQKGETHSCQLLPNGRILAGLSYTGSSYILEIDFYGTLHKQLHVPTDGTHHGSFRNIRKTQQGTYLLTRNSKPYIGLEVDHEGTVLRKFKDGRYIMIRLPNGNTLVSGADAHRVYEIDANDNEVWALNQDDIEGITLAAVCGIQRLPNGNTIISSWGGHGTLSGPAVIEVTREKKLVWKTPDFIQNRVLSLQVLDVHSPYRETSHMVDSNATGLASEQREPNERKTEL